MAAYLTGRQVRLTIGGNDWSDYLLDAEMQTEELDLGDGLIRTFVTLTLDVSENLSQATYRLNPTQWAKGTAVLLEIDSDNQGTYIVPNCPTGRLFILKEPSTPSVSSPNLQVNCGCALAYKDFYTVDDDVSGVTVGTSTAREIIVGNILTHAGLTPSLSAIPYPMDYPTPKSGGSYVQLAGKMAIAANHCLYIDREGDAVNKAVDLEPSTAALSVTVGSDEVFWEPSEDTETPAEKLIVSGVTKDVDTLPYTEKVVTTSGTVATVNPFAPDDYTPVDPITRTTIRDFAFDSSTRSKVTEVTEEGIGATLINPIRPSDSRFLTLYTSDVTTTTERYGTDKLVEKSVKTRNNALLEEIRDWKLDRTLYFYDDDGLVRRTLELQKRVKLLVAPFVNQNDRFDFIDSKIIDTTWENVKGDIWAKTVQESVPYYDTGVPLTVVNGSLSDEFYRLSAKPAITTTASDGSTQPPQTQYLSKNALTEKTIEACVNTRGLGAVSDGDALTKDIRVEHAVSTEQLDAHGKVHAGLLWGRRFGWRLGIPLTADVFNIEPLDRVDVTDGSTVYRLLVDGISIVLEATEAYAFFTGIEVGVAPVSSPSTVTRLYEGFLSASGSATCQATVSGSGSVSGNVGSIQALANVSGSGVDYIAVDTSINCDLTVSATGQVTGGIGSIEARAVALANGKVT